jgi:hypothetical protein
MILPWKQLTPARFSGKKIEKCESIYKFVVDIGKFYHI